MRLLSKLAFVLGISSLLSLSVAHAANYEIDPNHSEVSFKVRHLGISSVTGRFGSFTGTFSYDPKNVAASKAQATIDVTSVDTNQKKRDGHLTGCDFFCAEKFPKLEFVTTSVKPLDGNKFEIVGDLSMHGIKKSVILEAEYQGEAKDPQGTVKAGFSATGKLNRKDFDLKWSAVTEAGNLVVGDEISITLDIQAKKVG